MTHVMASGIYLTPPELEDDEQVVGPDAQDDEDAQEIEQAHPSHAHAKH
jgi:hypothetical protein